MQFIIDLSLSDGNNWEVRSIRTVSPTGSTQSFSRAKKDWPSRANIVAIAGVVAVLNHQEQQWDATVGGPGKPEAERRLAVKMANIWNDWKRDESRAAWLRTIFGRSEVNDPTKIGLDDLLLVVNDKKHGARAAYASRHPAPRATLLLEGRSMSDREVRKFLKDTFDVELGPSANPGKGAEPVPALPDALNASRAAGEQTEAARGAINSMACSSQVSGTQQIDPQFVQANPGLLPPTGQGPPRTTDLWEFVQPYRPEAADDWGETRSPMGGIGDRLLASCGANPPRGGCRVLVRCLAVRTWGSQSGGELAREIGRRFPRRQAHFFIIEPHESLSEGRIVDQILAICRAGDAPKTFVLFLAGYRPIRELGTLADGLHRDCPQANLVALAYATRPDMKRLVAWEQYQVVPPATWCLPALRDVPAELDGRCSPLTRLSTRPECRPAFLPDEREHEYSTAALTCGERWRDTLQTIRDFIEQNSIVPDLDALADAWASRAGKRVSAGAVRLVNTSGLFFPDLRDVDGRSLTTGPFAGPVAGAIGAYLDGIYLAAAKTPPDTRRQLFRSTLRSARSRRRQPMAAEPTFREVTSWLALIVAVQQASDKAADALIGAVARIDINIAFDLYGVRKQVTGAHVSEDNIIFRLLEHAAIHGNAVAIPFGGTLDEYSIPARPTIAPPSQYELARRILDQAPDPELLVTLLASCAIVDGGPIRAQWNRVVPERVSGPLRDLGERLRRSAIPLATPTNPRGLYAAAQLVSVDDLRQAFPGIGRCHRRGSSVALVPWTTACVLACGCGGGLPDEEQFKLLRGNRLVHAGVLTSLSGTSPRFPFAGTEWLGSNADDLEGAEFTGEWPRLFERLVGVAHWRHPDVSARMMFADVHTAEMTARPRRQQLAAFRVVFYR